jgi:hypothetical protein
VTGIEPTLSAWESVQSGPSIWPDLRSGLSVSDRESPRFTQVNGPLMARRLDHVEGRPPAFQAGHMPSCYGSLRAGVLHCRRSLPLAVGRCCCCYRGFRMSDGQFLGCASHHFRIVTAWARSAEARSTLDRGPRILTRSGRYLTEGLVRGLLDSSGEPRHLPDLRRAG